MISWMQKHNRYLVWTIWVATITFIGAGFVGWGTYSYGTKASAVAKVGEIEISRSKLDMVYSNIYNQYNEMMQGQLDEAKAKELGLVQRAFATLATQAKILNFSKEMGIVVSDKELADQLQSIKSFQKDGKFDKSIYEGYLKNQRLKAKVFESMLRDDLTISKTLNLFNIPTLPLEVETIGSALNVADKIAYKVLTPADINLTLDESKIKSFWETQKESYMTPKTYVLSVVWTPSADTQINEDEIKSHYDTNSFNYITAEGKQLSFDEAKEMVIKDLKLAKTKKTAQKDYITFKKNEIQAQESLKLSLNDPKLTAELWTDIQLKGINDILKPKVVGDRYATIKIDAIEEPKTMGFDEAKQLVTDAYRIQEQQNMLSKLAQTTLDNFKDANATVSDFVTFQQAVNLKPMNTEESLQFLQKLFTSSKEKGIIAISDKVIVYDIMEQKLLPVDANQSTQIEKNVNQLKQNVFESNFIRTLDERYPTEVFMGGLTN